MSEIEDVLEHLHLSIENIEYAHRLGNRLTGSRPIRAVCIAATKKYEILRRSKSLRHSQTFKDIYINPDLTPLQQKESRLLRIELKQRREIGEDVMIRRGKIVSKRNEQNFRLRF